MNKINALDLSQALLRCPSITPLDAGALDVLEAALNELGFTCHRLPFKEVGTPDVDNLYARIGTSTPNFCFAGHTDVVPVGDLKSWNVNPFSGEIVGEKLYGRGAADMKTAIACFTEASARFIEKYGANFGGSISLLITGDEEGPAINGTKKLLNWCHDKGEIFDACLVGEPTNPTILGEMIKIGKYSSI